ncbi:MAG TPA: glycosyltransferase family 1 protein [Caulobacteraceae bacterium]|nr:glycosyltransferase family 1 protein [Caulobacteraceae bacterium]
MTEVQDILVGEPRRAQERPLRVALFTGSYNYIADGVALTLNRLVGYLMDQGVEVLVFAPVGPRAALVHRGELTPVASIAVPLRTEYRLALGLTARARSRLETFAPDVVHIATPDLLGRDAQAFARRLGRPVIASYHTRYETYLKYYGLGLLERVFGRWLGRFYDRCTEILAPSPSMVDVLAASGVTRPVHLWPRGVDLDRFDPARRSLAWRRARGVADDEVLVAFVSRLVKEKRVDDFVDAVSAAQAAGARVRPLVVGDGPEREALARRLPTGVFEGFLVGDALATAYASADIFLFPSDTETFGSVTLEAMASGLPTVCADATGSRSLVEPGVTGFLAEVGDVPGLTAAVTRLAEGVDLRREMGAAARRRATTFSWDEAMAGVLARYLALADRAA